MRRDIELRAGIAVNHNDIAIVRAQATNSLIVIELKRRECRPNAGIFRRDQK
jgi:hypothetical protein